MRRGILIDEIQLTFVASRRLPRERHDAVAKALRSKRFRTVLQEGVRKVVKQFAALRDVRFALYR
jgi:hypothetical protein